MISGVEPASPAGKSGIKPGEKLIDIGGHEIIDVLDYRFYMMARMLELTLERPGGQRYALVVHKGEYDELGLEFETYLMDKQRQCKNKCVFCFIDQMPRGMRDSLYFKDDDSRLSFLFGNYITLTNLQDMDIERIIAMRISPINISVHTMNPGLRVTMMANPNAGDVLRHIPRLVAAGIKVNTQLVLCPGVNDGAELTLSLSALCALGEGMQSIAVVPVGLTRHREDLAALRLFERDEAAAVIDAVDSFGALSLEEHGRRICFASDEFYLTAQRKLPGADFYEDFDQLENGVGMLALLKDEFMQALDAQDTRSIARCITIATGAAAQPFIARLAALAMHKFSELHIKVIAINNNFFGQTITVAGLVTGGDMIKQLRDADIGDELLFPSTMLRHERDIFLDDISVEILSDRIGKPVCPVDNDGWALLDAMLGV